MIHAFAFLHRPVCSQCCKKVSKLMVRFFLKSCNLCNDTACSFCYSQQMRLPSKPYSTLPIFSLGPSTLQRGESFMRPEKPSTSHHHSLRSMSRWETTLAHLCLLQMLPKCFTLNYQSLQRCCLPILSLSMSLMLVVTFLKPENPCLFHSLLWFTEIAKLTACLRPFSHYRGKIIWVWDNCISVAPLQKYP